MTHCLTGAQLRFAINLHLQTILALMLTYVSRQPVDNGCRFDGVRSKLIERKFTIISCFVRIIDTRWIAGELVTSTISAERAAEL